MELHDGRLARGENEWSLHWPFNHSAQHLASSIVGRAQNEKHREVLEGHSKQSDDRPREGEFNEAGYIMIVAHYGRAIPNGRYD